MPTLEEIYGTSGPTERLAYNLTEAGLQNPDIDRRGGGMTWTGDGPLVTINGKQYMRLRTNDPAAISSFDAFGGGVFRDPTYGYVVPLEVAQARSASSEDFFDKYGVALATAGIGAVTAPAIAAGVEGASALPNSYWSMTADAGGLSGTMTDALGSGFAEAGASQAIDGSMQSIYDAFANAGVPGYSTGLTSGVAAGGAAGSTLANMASNLAPKTALDALSRILKGDGGLDDWLKVGGAVGPSLIGAYSANKQADAYRDQMDKYFGLGAPSRARFEGSFAPGFSMENEPGYKQALETAQDQFLRAASAGRASGVSRGNPFDNPGAWAETMKYVLGSTALPALQNYRNTNAAAGQLGVSQSVPFGQGQIQSQGDVWGDLGYGLKGILDQQTPGIQLPGTTGDIIPEVGPRFRWGGLA